MFRAAYRSNLSLSSWRRCLSDVPLPLNVVHDSMSGRKRFYKRVDVAEVPGSSGWVSCLYKYVEIYLMMYIWLFDL